MKKIIYVAVLSLSSVVAHAWEYPQNPDRFPSVGFGVQGNIGSGESKTNSTGFSRSTGSSRDFDVRGVSPHIDTRLPLSDSFTLSLNAGFTESTTKTHAVRSSPSSKSSVNSGVFGVEGRYYFNGAR